MGSRSPRSGRSCRASARPSRTSTAATELERLARRFPGSFLFGAATAAYQIEGAHDADGKGPSIWDRFTRVPGAISTGENGDVACDHYHRWPADLRLMGELGLRAYRFSISWSRVLPDGTGAVNERGLEFYERLVEGLLERGIRPFVTLYHWDLPEALQRRRGWANPDAPGWFGEYATVVGQRLGDRVRDWLTLNEPQIVAFLGHESGVHAPGIRDRGTAFRVAHQLLLAHREGSRALRASGPAATVGIALNLSPVHAATESDADRAAAAREDLALNRWFLDPLFGRGYPGESALRLDGYDGELDFLGINYYNRHVVRALDAARHERVRPPGEYTDMGWEVHPEGLRELLVRVHRDYRPQTLHVTENGAAYHDALEDGRVRDARRVRYLARHVAAAADALEAGVPLGGYFVWSLLDNFEWAYGFSKRFGIVYTDYPTQRRIVKASGEWYRSLIAAWAATA